MSKKSNSQTQPLLLKLLNGSLKSSTTKNLLSEYNSFSGYPLGFRSPSLSELYSKDARSASQIISGVPNITDLLDSLPD